MFAALPSLDSLYEQAVQTSTDTLGNIFNADGIHSGVVPGSVADIGTTGTSTAAAPASSSIPLTLASSSNSGSSMLKAASDVGNKVKTAIWKGYFGVGSLEDFICIILGLILIAASLYSFRPVQEVVNEAARGMVEGVAAAT
jgi:hypothetical protein